MSTWSVNEGELPARVTEPTAAVDDFLGRYVRSLGLPDGLTDAVLYSLLGPGKRARPLLAVHSYRAAARLEGHNGAIEPALATAAAVELVHAFSLVHDDLPGIDNDDLRRGRPTLHRQTTEAMAILAGDAMLTLALQVLAERYEPALAAVLVRELTQATSAMIVGQVYDTLGGFPRTPPLTDVGRLQLVHRNKTGALLRASCRMGALAAQPKDRGIVESLTRYGESIGLMFQIVDDLLDVTQTTDHLGKKSGKDAEAGKLTYPGVLGIEASREEVRKLHAESLAALSGMGEGAEPLRDMANFLAVRTK